MAHLRFDTALSRCRSETMLGWPDHKNWDWTLKASLVILFSWPPAKGGGDFPAAIKLTKQLAKDGSRLRALARVLLSNPELKDAYTALLGSLRLGATSNHKKSILITSTQPNEGKTTVASCLAVTASLAGQTVLLIDGDLRRRGLASAAGVVDGIGLTEILEGDVEADEAIQPVELFEDGRVAGTLSIIAAGRRPPEILPAVDWPRARSTFRGIAERFGIVLFDSPPILAANDALLLAGIVDGILLIVDAGAADRHQVRRAKEQLDSIGTPVIGAVLNQFDPKVHGQSSQPYRDYYLARS
jgi:protein-tyrosine kinase